MTRTAIGIFIVLFALSTPAFATSEEDLGKKMLGMHHMSITDEPAKVPETTAPQPKTETAPAPAQDAPKEEAQPLPKALKPEEALKELKGLTEWPYYADLMTVDNDTALEDVIHRITIDPGSVPPKGLLYLAKALADRKRYEEAAFYFYAGQLRATFDMARFPPYQANSDDKKDKEKQDKRTEDQKGEVPDAAPEMINPHDSITMLALSIGPPISKWSMTDPSRLDAVMAKVRSWDLATPYAYLPDYDTSHAAPYDQWPQLLIKTRNDYFTRARQISHGLKSLKPDAPAPVFSRP